MPFKSTSEEITSKAVLLRLLRQRNFPELNRIAADVLEENKNNPDLIQIFAISFNEQADHEKANKLFQLALKNSPKRTDIRNNYSNALIKQGKIFEAEQQCLSSLESSEVQPEVLNTLGTIYLQKKHLSKAEECFRKSLDGNQRNANVLNNLGISLQRQNRIDDSIAAYQKSLEVNPAHVESLSNLGIARLLQGQISDSFECFQKVIRIAPDHKVAKYYINQVSPVWLEPLEGHHLIVRPGSADDVEFLYQCHNNAEFMLKYNRFLVKDTSLEALKGHLQKAEKIHPCQKKSIDWIIINKETGNPIGLMGLVDIHGEHRRAEFVIGIPNKKHRIPWAGIEASLLAFEFAFRRVDLNKLSTYIYSDNMQAQKTGENLGFHQEGYLNNHIFARDSNKYLDVFLNGLTRDDFIGNSVIGELSLRLLGRDIRFTN